MNDSRTVTLACLTLLSFVLPSLSIAQDSSAVDHRITAVAPFLDAESFGIVHVDLKQLDIKAAFDRFATLAPESAKEMLPTARIVSAQGEQIRKQVVAAGVSDLYFILAMRAGATEPDFFAVATVEQGKDPEAARTALLAIPGTKEEDFFVHKGYLVGCPPNVKEYVTSIQAVAHPALADSFRYAGKTTFQFVLLPSKKLLETAKKSVPPGVPVDLSAADDKAEDFKSFVLTANLPPKPALAIIGHTENETSAKAAVDEISKMLDSDETKKTLALPALAKLAPFLRPLQDGPRIKFIFTEANGGIAALANSVKMGIEMAGPALQGGFPGGPPGIPTGP